MGNDTIQATATLKPPRKRRRILLWLGIILLLLDACAAFGWWYYIQPMRHTCSAKWRNNHTDQEVWDEIQRRIHHVGWMHDDFGDVGMRGDKKWAEWVVRHVRPDENLSGCQTGHKNGALEYMANQKIGDIGKDCIVWWEKNKDKSQEDWIRDGFAANGLILHKPLDMTDLWHLLAVMDRMGEETDARRSPWYRYNAARMITASGLLRELDPSQVPAELQASVFRGLKEYSCRCGGYVFSGQRVNSDLGLIEPDAFNYDPLLCKPCAAYYAYEIMLTVAALGSVLLAFFFVRRRARRGDGDTQPEGRMGD